MLKIGSRVEIFDTSGAISVAVLNMKTKKTYKSACLDIMSLFLGVVKKAEIKRKLTKKEFTTVIIVALKKKRSRGNGIYVNFDKNRGIPLKITRFIVPVGSHIFTSVSYELRTMKKYKVVARIAGRAF